MKKYPVIAVDGTSASGKGTLSKKLSAILEYPVLETGKLYRYVGYMVLQKGGDPGNEDDAVAAAHELQQSFKPENLQSSALLTDESGMAASKAGVFKDVRAALLDFQRNFANCPPGEAKGAILDGRDIGTVICPDADVKFYVDAKTEIRAQRRHKELQSNNILVTYEAVLADMHERDRRDAERSEAPLKPAADAIMLDTSDMSVEDVVKTALSHIKDKLF